MPDISGAAKCSFALRKAFMTERTAWSVMMGIIIMKRYVATRLCSGANPGAITFMM